MRAHTIHHGSSGPSVTTTIAALAISGCTLLVLTFLRRRKLPDTSSEAIPSVTGVTKKKVMFSEDVAGKEGEGDMAGERRRRRRLPPAATAKNIVGKERSRSRVTETVKAELPANRSALYGGIYQYRSQMETLMLYAS